MQFQDPIPHPQTDANMARVALNVDAIIRVSTLSKPLRQLKMQTVECIGFFKIPFVIHSKG
jgi:hypothetical protein